MVLNPFINSLVLEHEVERVPRGVVYIEGRNQ